MATRLFIGKDLNGTPCNTIVSPTSNTVMAQLPATVAIETTVPENVDTAYFAFGGQGDVWVNLYDAAILPTNTFASTTSELNPVSRFVTTGMTISAICRVDNDIQISFVNANKVQT